MEEHQNNTDVQDNQAHSGNGEPKVMKAGSEAKAGRRILRSDANNGGNSAEGFDHAAEAARNVMRAGQQTLEGARAATYAAVDSGNPAEGSDHATEAARTVMRAGQQALEGGRAATYAVAEASDSKGAGQVLEELANCVGRAYHRNIQAVSDLKHCYTFQSLLQWQSNLLNAAITDWMNTNARILQLVTHKA